jgi:PAS domain S-box-containing protein
MIYNSENEILIVEDTVASLKLLTDILNTAGYKVRPASDGELALRSISAKRPSLILLDIRMPGIDGYEVCRRLKADERTKDIPIIFISSLSDISDKVIGFQLGAVDYITKPFQREELLARVQTHMNLSILQNHLEMLVEERTSELLSSENDFKTKAEELRIVADYASNWEYWVGIDGTYRYVSPSCEKISGYTRAEFYENQDLMLHIIHPDDKALYMQHLKEITEFHSDDSEMIQLKIVTKSGEIRYIEHVCNAIHNEQGIWLGQRGSNIDITERKKAEQAIFELNRSLEKRVEEEVAKNREKDHILIQQSRLAAMGEMIHNIAHQWRQPLNALSILASNIKDDFDYKELTAESLTKDIEKIKQLLQKMSSTIDDFRDFFRPDREASDFDISNPIKESLSIMEATLKNNNINITTSFPKNLNVYGFKNQLSQTILNIIANAKEAIVEKHIANGKIEIVADTIDNNVIITIEDNGGGIPDEILPKIFDPYFSTKYSGSGIGLYMSKTIIEHNFKGTIRACNKDDGVQIIITIPLSHKGF